MSPTSFEKLTIAARYWLLGMAESDPAYFKVVDALELCLEHHDGLRNGGEPEAIHQLGIFHWARTHHKHIRNPALVYTLIFLHDAVEDPNQASKRAGKPRYISLEDIEQRFGSEVRTKVLLISKEVLGQPNATYSLDTIFSDPDLSIAKGGDRVNNVGSMVGVFKRERLLRYVTETRDEFLPRIKTARRLFPDQEGVYESMKYELTQQLDLIERLVTAEAIDTQPEITS